MRNKKHVLHIDDDQDDLYAFREAVCCLPHEIVLVQEQEAATALHYLRSLQHHDQLPNLIVVDLNMPGISGKDFLTIIKNDPVFKDLPVVAFSTSSLLSDKDYCSGLGVAFLTKPSLFTGLVDAAREMLSFCG